MKKKKNRTREASQDNRNRHPDSQGPIVMTSLKLWKMKIDVELLHGGGIASAWTHF